jgi:Transglycosylase-like domain
LRNHTANRSFRCSESLGKNARASTLPTAIPTSTPAATPIAIPIARTRRWASALLVASVSGFVGLASLVGAAPFALSAEPSGLPQAYSAKIVDTASLSPLVTVAVVPVVTVVNTASVTAVVPSEPTKRAPIVKGRKGGSAAPVVSMLPVPTSIAPEASTTDPKPKSKKKAKKVAPTTTSAGSISEEALGLPSSTAKSSKTSDSKASDSKAAVEAKETSANSSLDAAFAALRKCESGGNYKTATGNGYYGAYQFDPGTWRTLGYSGLPSDAAPEVQDEAARKLQAKSGWGQWPACSRKLGLR